MASGADMGRHRKLDDSRRETGETVNAEPFGAVHADFIMSNATESPTRQRHALWVRVCHWVLALSVLTLAYSGLYILMAHPRLYWGEVGNDLTPAWLELPLNDNHRPEGWQQTVTFEALANKPISASRTIEIFNENGWARSLHFLAGWFFVVAGAFYFALRTLHFFGFVVVLVFVVGHLAMVVLTGFGRHMRAMIVGR